MRGIRFRNLLSVLPLLLTACAVPARTELPLTEGQTAAQARAQLQQGQSGLMVAAWIPYFTTEALLAADDETACRAAVGDYLQKLSDCGVQTVFLHVCAFGESCYPSAYYPELPAANGHDGMQIFTELCREKQIALHAWINPLRLQTADVMQQQTGDSALCTWFHSDALRKLDLLEWDGRYYLNPDAETAGKFLTGAITELMLRYHPAGIHVDDYFYPTTDPAFDADAFAASGASDLTAWRRGRITACMQMMYRAVHNADPDAVFSVSPQGSMQKNTDTLYADVPAWLLAGDCCDLIIPQLYFGYRNESCPFAEMLREWVSLPRAESVQMAVGLGVYKYGQDDPYAGSGADEWSTGIGLPAVQTADVLSEPTLCGVAYYDADSLLALPETESAQLRETIAAAQNGANRQRYPK